LKRILLSCDTKWTEVADGVMAVKRGAISAALTKTALMVVTCMVVGGCNVSRLSRSAERGTARITIPRIDDHTMAVYLYATHSKHRFVEHSIPKEQRDGLDAFSLSPGTHVLEIDCHRPKAVAVVHGGIDFEVTVEADAMYVLDCDPKPDPDYGYYDNHFSLTRIEPKNSPDPPLELGPWLWCYAVSAGEGETPMPLGTVRLIDRLEPATAGMYEAHVVKSVSHLVSVAWWPVSATSFHLELSDGYNGWSGDLEQTSTGLQGWAIWANDTGKRESGSRILASRTTCDP